MPDRNDQRLTLASVRARYDAPHYFCPTDPWHAATARAVRAQLLRAWRRVDWGENKLVLNLGSGSTKLPFDAPKLINIDVSEVSLREQVNPIVGTVEGLPIRTASVDIVICVGSVINYCDAAAAIAEFSRVLPSRGRLFLEFESSGSAEWIRTPDFEADAALFDSFYGAQPELIWAYNLRYVRGLLEAAALSVNDVAPIQIVSPWILLATESPHLAANFASLDAVARKIGLLSRWASNLFVAATKL